jgi:thioredoxin reductase
MENFKKHAKVSGSEILQEMIEKVDKHENHFHITTNS